MERITNERAEELASEYYRPHRFGDTPAWYDASVRLAKRALEAEAKLLAYRESRALEALKNYRFIDHETCVEKGGPIDMRCSACKVADAAIAKLEAINA